MKKKFKYSIGSVLEFLLLLSCFLSLIALHSCAKSTCGTVYSTSDSDFRFSLAYDRSENAVYYQLGTAKEEELEKDQFRVNDSDISPLAAAPGDSIRLILRVELMDEDFGYSGFASFDSSRINLISGAISESFINKSEFLVSSPSLNGWELKYHQEHNKTAKYDAEGKTIVSTLFLELTGVLDPNLFKVNQEYLVDLRTKIFFEKRTDEDGDRNSFCARSFKGKVIENNLPFTIPIVVINEDIEAPYIQSVSFRPHQDNLNFIGQDYNLNLNAVRGKSGITRLLVFQNENPAWILMERNYDVPLDLLNIDSEALQIIPLTNEAISGGNITFRVFNEDGLTSDFVVPDFFIEAARMPSITIEPTNLSAFTPGKSAGRATWRTRVQALQRTNYFTEIRVYVDDVLVREELDINGFLESFLAINFPIDPPTGNTTTIRVDVVTVLGYVKSESYEVQWVD